VGQHAQGRLLFNVFLRRAARHRETYDSRELVYCSTLGGWWIDYNASTIYETLLIVQHLLPPGRQLRAGGSLQLT
jgi:hypothetical protein